MMNINNINNQDSTCDINDFSSRSNSDKSVYIDQAKSFLSILNNPTPVEKNIQSVAEEKNNKLQEQKRIKAEELEKTRKREELEKEVKSRSEELLKRKKAEKQLLEQREKLIAIREREAAKEEAKRKKNEAKELAKQEARLLKVEKAKESQYKKNNKAKTRNVKMYKSLFIGIAFLAVGGFAIHQSGLFEGIVNEIEQVASDKENQRVMDEAKEKAKNKVVDNNTNYVTATPTETPVYEEVPEVTPVIEAVHETIDTSYYNNPDYEFNEEITPEYLKELNPKGSDNLAWITIPGTKVDYPVAYPSVKKIDEVKGLAEKIEKSGKTPRNYMNEYFLHCNLVGKESDTKGTIYIDAFNRGLNNHFDKIDDCTVIYGHNMKDDSMFGTIEEYKKQSYFDKHPYAIMYTDDGYGYVVEFIASKTIKGTEGELIYTGNFDSIEEKNAYVQDIIDYSIKHKRGMQKDYEIQDNDKYIILVTCDHSDTNLRLLLIGKISSKVKVRDTSLTDDQNGYYVEDSNVSTLHR